MGNCCVTVPADELVAVERFGKFTNIASPGLHCLGLDICELCLTTRSISSRVMENTVKCETKTKDNVFVSINVAVQMEVIRDRAKDAIYRLTSPFAQIDSYVGSVVRGKVPTMNMDEVFASKDDIALAVKTDLEKHMEQFGYYIHTALVTDVDPDQGVKNAMNQIDASKRLRIAAADKAEAEKIMQVKAAEAEAESKFLQGQGIARQRSAIIDGLVESLNLGEDRDHASDKVRELLLITQYFDTLKDMAQGPANTIFMPHTVGGLQDITTQIQQGIISGIRST